MKQNINVLVMAGGSGTRFWPSSTKSHPKQYLKLSGKSSLLAQTLERFDNIVEIDNRFIVTIEQQKEILSSNISKVAKIENVIFEPSSRNTAPCILLSLAKMLKQGAKIDDVCVVVPSDHVILNTTAFSDTILKAVSAACNSQAIVTIGIKPHFPHTGYGYIKIGQQLKVEQLYKVDSFKEKPDYNTAQNYLKSGEFLWNAGMFLAKISTFLEEFEKHAPDLFGYWKKIQNAINKDDGSIADLYNLLPSDSIDYAIMEKSENVLVTPATFDWNDLGSWDSLESVILLKDENTFISTDDYFLENSSGNIISAPKQFVSLVDVKDLIIVSNDKTLMILPKSKSQKVKNIVQFLEKNKRDELL